MEYLFLLEEMFKKDDLLNVYSKFMSDRIEEIGISKYDVKKAKKTGWKPKYKINNGIYKTIEFYERNRKFL